MANRKLKAWEQAGLIDAATAARIREWESAHARPIGLWSVIGLAALTIALGLVSIVAANWDAIAGELRLAIHFGLMVALALFIAVRRRGAAGSLSAFGDALLLIFAALGLTFLGHLGQVYQTSSPLWKPLALWLVLFSPVLLGLGRTWLIAAIWMITVVATAWLYVGHATDGNPREHAYSLGFITGLPALVAGLAALVGERSLRVEFWRKLEQSGVLYAVLGAGLSILSSGLFSDSRSDTNDELVVGAIQSLLAAGSGVLVLRARPGESGAATGNILFAAAIANGLAPIPSGSDVGPALLFLAFVGSVAFIGLRAGWRVVFQLSVAVAALRLVVLSFELANDLLGSGLGLILAGLITLAIAWLAIRTSREYAPKARVE